MFSISNVYKLGIVSKFIKGHREKPMADIDAYFGERYTSESAVGF